MPTRKPARLSTLQKVGIYAGIISACAAIFGLWWKMQVESTSTHVQGPTTTGPVADGCAGINSGIINNIFNGQPPKQRSPSQVVATCENVMNAVFPSTGMIYVIHISEVEEPYNPVLGTISGKPGTEFSLGFNKPERCRFNNYSESPIFKPKVYFHAMFWNAVKNDPPGGGSHKGKMTLDTNWQLELPKIDAGKDDPFDLYLVNPTSQFAQIILAPKICLNDGVTLDMVQPSTTGMHFSPFVPAGQKRGEAPLDSYPSVGAQK
jgi:hypothetical protein